VLIVAEGEGVGYLDRRLVEAQAGAEEDAVELRVRGARREGSAQSNDQPSQVVSHWKAPFESLNGEA